jgi:hypothetical protein
VAKEASLKAEDASQTRPAFDYFKTDRVKNEAPDAHPGPFLQ